MRIEGARMVLDGVLDAATVPALARAAQGVANVEVIDLHGVSTLDSAGLAWLGLLQESHPHAQIEGAPPAVDALRQAYRLDERLGFAG